MADNSTPTPDSTGFPDPSKNNEEVARKLAEQSLSEKPASPDVLKETGDALDALLAQTQKDVNQEDEAAKKAAEEKAAADKIEADRKAAAERDANDPAKQAEKAAAEKAAAEKAEADKKKADDFFKDSPSLPAGASPKSAEAFASIKIKAAQEISTRDQKITELENQKKELETKLQNPVPAEVEKELKELREWRAKLDVDIDPKFKEYEKTVENAREFIYAQLKKSPKVGDDVIDRIKEVGGPDMVKLDKIFEAIGDPTIQRLVESKIADIEQAKFNKEQAQAAAKKNIDAYLSERQKAFESSAGQHNKDTEAELNKIVPKLDYLQEKPVPATADEPTRKSLEAHNKFAKETLATMKSALSDDSPEMRAVMIAGLAQLLHTKPQLKVAQDRVADLEKQLAEANAKIDKFKNASVSRLRDSAVPPGGKTPEVKKEPDLNMRAGDALDAIAKGIQEEQARASK